MVWELPEPPMPRPPEAAHSATRYQIAEQLRYVGAILEMLESGTWSAAAGRQLDARLSVLEVAAGQLSWSALRLALADLRRELGACVQGDRAPDPAAAAALHAALSRALALR